MLAVVRWCCLSLLRFLYCCLLIVVVDPSLLCVVLCLLHFAVAVECCLSMSVVVCVGSGLLCVGGVCGVLEVFVVAGR